MALNVVLEVKEFRYLLGSNKMKDANSESAIPVTFPSNKYASLGLREQSPCTRV